MTGKKTIGIVGGVGPLAGADLFRKIVAHTKANRDQDHISTIMLSMPSLVPDRTGFLLNGGEDPEPGIQRCVDILAAAGADAFGICCNTAHSPRIIGRLDVPEGITFVNMIDSTCRYISERHPGSKIGIIATLGTIRTGIYDKYFSKYDGLTLVKPDDAAAQSVQDAIYDKKYGIKATPAVTDEAFRRVSEAVIGLKAKGCRAVILGCTELPLVFPGQAEYQGIELIDPTERLAVELIKATEPEKLI